MADNKKIAADVLEAVGGKDNVSFVAHCMTRLRFNFKDMSKVDVDRIGKIKGVIGSQESGGQYQIIIGQNVPKVYEELCSLGGFKIQDAIDENLDAPKEKLTLKRIGSNILDYLSGSMVGIIPVIIGAALFKTVAVLCGPDMFNIITEDSDLYVLMNMLYNAGFYFLPMYLGWSAAKKIGASPVLGLFTAAVLIEPTFMSMAAEEGSAFTVYGIPAPLANYSQTVLPILLCVPVLYAVEKFFKKVIPDVMSTVFVPFLTMAVMVPVELCLLAPIGNELGNVIGNAMFAFGNVGGFVAVALLCAVWEFLVMTGMHGVIMTLAIMQILSTGQESFVMTASGIAGFAAWGMALGGFLRLKSKEEKGLALGYFISGVLGGVTEPVLFGLGLRYKRPFIGCVVGGLVGGAIAGLLHVTCYAPGASNFLKVVNYIPGGTTNFVGCIVASVAAMLVSAAMVYFFGFSKKDLEAAE